MDRACSQVCRSTFPDCTDDALVPADSCGTTHTSSAGRNQDVYSSSVLFQWIWKTNCLLAQTVSFISSSQSVFIQTNRICMQIGVFHAQLLWVDDISGQIGLVLPLLRCLTIVNDMRASDSDPTTTGVCLRTGTGDYLHFYYQPSGSIWPSRRHFENVCNHRNKVHQFSI